MFDEKLAKTALTKFLLEMGIDKFMTSKFVNGHRKPNLKTAARIEAAIGIPASAWIAGVPLEEAWRAVLRRAE